MVEADQLTITTWRKVASRCPLWCSIRDMGYGQGRHGYVRGELRVYEDEGGFFFYHPGLRDVFVGVPRGLANEAPNEFGILIHSQLR